MELSEVRIVMVRPRGPQNVGMAARAVANHGLAGLTLVAPACFDPDEARFRAPGAQDVVDGAHIVATVAEAVAHARLVVGTTARSRRWRWPVWTPARLADAVLDGTGPAVVLFGPEDSGLSNEDLVDCHAVLTLPTTAVSSLNLAQAITVTCHALRARLAERMADPPPTAPPATAALLGDLTDNALAVLHTGGYMPGHSEEQVRVTLMTFLARLAPTQAEAGMLNGMLAKVRWTLDHPDQAE